MCGTCGAKDTSQENMQKHEAWHAKMTAELKGLTTYAWLNDNAGAKVLADPKPERSWYVKKGRVLVEKKKCSDCNERIATAKGRCARCYETMKRRARGILPKPERKVYVKKGRRVAVQKPCIDCNDRLAKVKERCPRCYETMKRRARGVALKVKSNVIAGIGIAYIAGAMAAA